MTVQGHSLMVLEPPALMEGLQVTALDERPSELDRRRR